jgi:predicted Rossmann-fold nucleotide-binding protein
VGTLDELIETLALVHLKKYDGKVAVLNHDGFYDPLKQLLDHYLQTRMMPLSTREKVLFADTPEELLDMIEG